MHILAITHAHLKPEGLSPVSCERVDSVTGTWAGQLNWKVDVVHTKGTRWVGIWPGGNGLKINTITVQPPADALIKPDELFSSAVRSHFKNRDFPGLASLLVGRLFKRISSALARRGAVLQHDFLCARKWGNFLAEIAEIKGASYDFLFVSAGYGDEYLLETALTLSKKLGMPMVVDLRDLWSEHHDPKRFTEEQKKQIRRQETRLLKNTVLISVPQKHMKVLLDKWAKTPVYVLAHSAYVEDSWADGAVVSNEFRMLYAGKLYAGGPGLKMLLELISALAARGLAKPFTCYFFVDETDKLRELARGYGIEQFISVHEWVSPAVLWRNLRSAHLLLIPDSGVAENYPLLPTKTFQYAYSGRQILCLLEYRNEEMNEFLELHHAGIAVTDTSDAVGWVTELAGKEEQYRQLPELRNIATRDTAAIAFAEEIEQIICKK